MKCRERPEFPGDRWRKVRQKVEGGGTRMYNSDFPSASRGSIDRNDR